ncbi:MAG: malonyl-CoA decarboxylase [Gammaproteobacteria bacterium]|nr:malonyl-CoA decarboxylase [Gammaproteobacteria bacterium]MCP5407801.1 malonyl-CoA decarboxylase [Chromatiaceae bacterium]MCP5441580.1 malonyl-CoA decarboxylase [Chromatiaceae bacterium]
MDQNDQSTLPHRTLEYLRRGWSSITEAALVRITGNVRDDLPEEDQQRLAKQIDECLEGAGGDVSQRARAADVGRTYLGLNDTGRRNFLEMLAREYGVHEYELALAMDEWKKLFPDGDHLLRHKAEVKLRRLLVSPRIQLLSQFNTLPEGVKFLVDMRAELVSLANRDPLFKPLEEDLRQLLASWFDVGFLELQSITWNAPASLLEKLAQYEAVHAVRHWSDIKNRMAADRRCYAFFHHKMPNEPIIYVWVALVKGISDNVQALLDVRHREVEEPNEADTAVFYSISNAQAGLKGISFGNFLIKRVVNALAQDFENLKTFVTLSPIPGFCPWLQQQLAEHGADLLLKAERKALDSVLNEPVEQAFPLMCKDHSLWYRKPEREKLIRGPLMRLCATYLSQAKRGSGVLDPVAHFHLSNGASMERINWLADTSSKGFKQSAGMMINYLYKTSRIEKNHEAYSSAGNVQMSSGFKTLLKS